MECSSNNLNVVSFCRHSRLTLEETVTKTVKSKLFGITVLEPAEVPPLWQHALNFLDLTASVICKFYNAETKRKCEEILTREL